jgi:hypothetical protein
MGAAGGATRSVRYGGPSKAEQVDQNESREEAGVESEEESGEESEEETEEDIEPQNWEAEVQEEERLYRMFCGGSGDQSVGRGTDSISSWISGVALAGQADGL